MVTLCTLRTATVLSGNCCTGFGRLFTGVKAPLRTHIVPLTAVCNPPPSVTPPEKVPECKRHFRDSPLKAPGSHMQPRYHHISSGVLLWLECESISCLRFFRAELHIEIQQRLKRYTAVRQLLDLWACISSTKQETKRPQNLYRTST